MSNERSPRLVCSITMGTRWLRGWFDMRASSGDPRVRRRPCYLISEISTMMWACPGHGSTRRCSPGSPRWRTGAGRWPRPWPSGGPNRGCPRPRSPPGWGRRSRRWLGWNPARRTCACPRWSGTPPRSSSAWTGACGGEVTTIEREWPAGVEAAMFERRLVYVRAPLDDRRAGEVTAQLMTLDAEGDDPVSVLIDCADATLDGAFAVVDTIDLLGVPVHATCIGRVEGPAVADG